MGGFPADTVTIDRALLARARGGDADAFCELIEPLQTQLLRQATALCGDCVAAEDLVQQTLVEGWRSLARYDGRCRLSTWLYAILVHRHYKSVRAAAARPVPLSRLVQPRGDTEASERRLLEQAAESPSPAEALHQREEHERLRRCLAALPLKHRQVVLLRFFDDASLAEIAAAMGCSVGTVKSRLHYALEKLRQMNLSAEEGDTPL